MFSSYIAFNEDSNQTPRYMYFGDLTKWETATRIRRKLQAKFKQLRDEETYKGRKLEETRWRDRFSPASMVYESDLS